MSSFLSHPPIHQRMPNLEAVIFDMGGVFVPTRRLYNLYSAMSLYARSLGSVKQNPIDYLKTVHRLMHTLMLGQCIEEFSGGFAQETGIKVDDIRPHLLASYEGISCLDPHMVLVVNLLKAKGIKIGLLSDTIRPHAVLFEERGLYGLFKPNVFLSCDYSAVKPDPYFFDAILLHFEMQGVECIQRDGRFTSKVGSAENVAFVDDNKEFVEAFVARYGGHGVIHRSAGRTRESLLSLLED